MEFIISDEILGTFVPIVVYWLFSGLYMLFGTQEKYRLHTKQDEDEKNLVSKANVIKGVLLQQAVQASVAMILFTVRLFISVCAYYACFEIRFRISKKQMDSHFPPSC